jgi:O-methyltransferase
MPPQPAEVEEKTKKEVIRMPEVRPLLVRSLQKTGLNKLAHHLYYSYVHGFDTASPAVLPALEACFQESIDRGLAYEGGYFEFGVFKGYTFWYAQDLARKHGLERMQFYGFDSFTGLPPVRGRDQTPHDEFYEGQYACSKETVVTNLNAKGVDWSRTHLVEGYFEHSLNDQLKAQLRQRPIAIALIDCDLYESTAVVLHFIDDLIADGTILLFDDWNCFNADDERGQRKAFADFLERNRHLSAQAVFSYGPYGQVFTMRTDRSYQGGAAAWLKSGAAH